jgi:hypothetical protein
MSDEPDLPDRPKTFLIFPRGMAAAMIYPLPTGPHKSRSRARGGDAARRSVRQREPAAWRGEETHDSSPETDRARHQAWLQARRSVSVPDAYHLLAEQEEARIRAREQDWRERLDREIAHAERPDHPERQARSRAQRPRLLPAAPVPPPQAQPSPPAPPVRVYGPYTPRRRVFIPIPSPDGPVRPLDPEEPEPETDPDQ